MPAKNSASTMRKDQLRREAAKNSEAALRQTTKLALEGAILIENEGAGEGVIYVSNEKSEAVKRALEDNFQCTLSTGQAHLWLPTQEELIAVGKIDIPNFMLPPIRNASYTKVNADQLEQAAVAILESRSKQRG